MSFYCSLHFPFFFSPFLPTLLTPTEYKKAGGGRGFEIIVICSRNSQSSWSLCDIWLWMGGSTETEALFPLNLTSLSLRAEKGLIKHFPESFAWRWWCGRMGESILRPLSVSFQDLESNWTCPSSRFRSSRLSLHFPRFQVPFHSPQIILEVGGLSRVGFPLHEMNISIPPPPFLHLSTPINWGKSY